MQDLLTRLLLAGGGGFSPSALFGGGAVQGAWYDPSDFGTTGTGGVGTLFQDDAGTTPVTAVEQPVGLMLDKSKGLVLGPELVTNGDFSQGTTGWSLGAGWSVGSGVASHVAGAAGSLFQSMGLTPGKWYRITFTVSNYAGGSVDFRFGGGPSGGTSRTANGTYTTTELCPVGAVGTGVLFGDASFVGSVDNITVKELPGNHAYQSTLASRPTLRARYNLLTYSEQFQSGVWVNAVGTTNVTTNTFIAPDGTLTADTLTAASNNAIFWQTYTPIPNTSYTGSIYIRRRTGTGNVDFSIDGSAFTTLSLTSDWQRVVSSGVQLAGTKAVGLRFATSGDAVDVWGAQLTATAVFPSNTYQRIADAATYATGTAFPPYLFFDGLDDSMLTNSVDFTGTDKMTVFAGVTKQSDAAATIVIELSSNISSNNGAFYLAAPVSDGTTTFQYASKGTTFDGATDSASTAPITAVLSGASNIGGPTNVLRKNGVVSASRTASQGTGNYGNYPLYIGRRNNASLPFNGNLYSLIVQGATPTSSQLVSTEQWVAAKTPLGSV